MILTETTTKTKPKGTTTINNTTVKTISITELPEKAEVKNAMISRVKIRRDRGFILGLNVEFASGRQTLFLGYNNTSNIGLMILALAELLGVNKDGESNDILGAFNGFPCRIAQVFNPGGSIADDSWIGHFMDDKFALAKDIVMIGGK